ncbi:S8 family anti-phage peptidase IteS [Oxalicibacterium faecigallinarum]
MATRGNTPERGRANTNNPIAHVSHSPGDLSAPDTGGSASKIHVPVTTELRASLRNMALAAQPEFHAESVAHPGIPSVLVMKLRDEAIAKTHRPVKLVTEAGLSPAGHGALNEFLVAGYESELVRLSHVIQTRTIQKIQANLSAIEGLEPWGVRRRLPKAYRQIPLDQVFTLMHAARKRLMLQLFSHYRTETTHLIQERLVGFLAELQLAPIYLAQRSGPFIVLIDMATMSFETFKRIVSYQGIKHVTLEPDVLPVATAPARGVRQTFAPRFTAANPAAGLPIVAVFDSGVAPDATALRPWVASSETYILPPDTNYEHGTAVSSLIVDGPGLNNYHAQFPVTPCRIHDVCALDSAGAPVSDLILRLRTAVANHPEIRVWNLSLGAELIDDDEFSHFGRELDALSDTYNILFVVAAGNYVYEPRRGWPIDTQDRFDRLTSPADSVRALTVGSIAHLDHDTTMVGVGEPAPYSRRGPGPMFTPKPDIVHFGGNTDHQLDPVDTGVHVLGPGNTFHCQCGTSFAAPIAASVAAHTWQSLSSPLRSTPLAVTPTMVKALMIHSAQLNSPDRNSFERRYYGAGLPDDPVSVLYDTDSSFTALFELDIVDSTKWRKTPYPIPPSMRDENGKLKGEVIITVAYAPPLNPGAGAEYVRFNVDVGFGVLTQDAAGKMSFNGEVPADGEPGMSGFEKAQLEHGGKWSTVKTYRREFQGKSGDQWAVQAGLLRREFEPPLVRPLRVIILITLRSTDGNQNIYREGRQELEARNWITQDLSQRVDVNLRT